MVEAPRIVAMAALATSEDYDMAETDRTSRAEVFAPQLAGISRHLPQAYRVRFSATRERRVLSKICCFGADLRA
jgi:hypothetical protein